MYQSHRQYRGISKQENHENRVAKIRAKVYLNMLAHEMKDKKGEENQSVQVDEPINSSIMMILLGLKHSKTQNGPTE